MNEMKYYYSTIKKNKIMPFAVTWMDLEIITLNEVNQTEKDKYHSISLVCGIKKKYTNELISKTSSQTYKLIYGYHREKESGGGVN